MRERRARMALATVALLVAGCSSPPGGPPLERRAVEGETLRYVMTGSNQGREHTREYEAEAEGRVVRDELGRLVEEFRWTRVALGGRDIPLDPASLAFRQ